MNKDKSRRWQPAAERGHEHSVAPARHYLTAEPAREQIAATDNNEIALRLVYRLPHGVPQSDTEWRKLHNADLDLMDRERLVTEVWRVRLTLAFGDLQAAPAWAENWLLERLRRCRALLGRGEE
ncbi:MAG: hypothetical protein H5T69_14495 [Chloroflexi bacterium]|nr:hypothetical protein [Chloroflexota bacterium]